MDVGRKNDKTVEHLARHFAIEIQLPEKSAFGKREGEARGKRHRCLRDNRGAVINFRPRAIIRFSGGKKTENNKMPPRSTEKEREVFSTDENK